MTLKEQMIAVIKRLPDDVTIEEAVEELYVLAKIQIGVREADAGKLIPHEEAMRRLLNEGL